MSGRRRATFAVDREPVLAWNVPTFHGGAPYPDMPAAAAVSPVVPPGADPYGRCWQNHVEAGCLPYIGTLYSSSLPSSYRVQPCVSSLGQIWPPTPPPDGCSRHDAASNGFYFCPPMSPMFVHGDSISQSIGSALPRVGHYSQLTEPNMESTVHSSGYQLETPKSSAPHLNAASCRTMPKCKSSNSAHPYDSTKKKPDVMLMSQGTVNTEKSVLNVHHSLCPCGGCSGKYFSDLTRGSDKENIHDSALHNAFHSDFKQASDKMKQKVCDTSKSENWNFLQFKGTSQEIPFDKCSCSIQGQCVIQPNYYKENKMSFASVKMPTKDTYKKPLNFPMTNADMMYNYSCSEPRRPNSSVCTTSSPYPVMTAPPTLSSSPSTSTSVRNAYPVSSVVSTPVREVYSIPLHLQMNADAPSYNKSCCFSPPYSRGRTLYHNASSEAEQSNQKQNSVVICGNSVNASPLKNVYFSHLESENINFDIHKCHQSGDHPSSLTADTASIAYATTVNANSSDFCNPYSATTMEYTKTQQKMASSSSLNSTPKLPRRKREDIEFIGEKKKTQRSHVKREKESADCEFQKSQKCSVFDYCSEMANTPSTPSALNLSTLGMWHKTELGDPGCNTVAAHKDSYSLQSSLPPEFGPDIQLRKQNDLPDETPNFDVKTPKHDLFQHVKSVAVCNETASAATAFSDILCSHMLQVLNENSSGSQTVSSDKKQANENMCEKMDSKTFRDSVETMLLPEDQDVKRDIRVASPLDTSDKGVNSPLVKFQTFEFETPPILLDQVDSKCNQKECDINQPPTEGTLERPSITCKSQNDSSDATKESTSLNLSPEATPVANESPQTSQPDLSSEEHETKSSKGKDQQNSLSPFCDEGRASPSISLSSLHDADVTCQADDKPVENQVLESAALLNNAEAPCDSSKNCCAESYNEKTLSPAGETVANSRGTEPFNAETSQCRTDHPEAQEEHEADSCDSLQSSAEFDEFHGLHLLLDGIAQREKNSSTPDITASDAHLTSNDGDIMDKENEELLQASSIAVNPVNLDNLSLLCACAEHLTVKCSSSTKSDEEVQSHKSPDINSNYPSIELEDENLKSSARGEHPFRNSVTEAEGADGSECHELEMRKKLAELQKKYKAKQKELARLKSRKGSSKKSIKRSGAETPKSPSVPHSNRSEPEDASYNLKDDSSAVDSSFSSPDRLHSTFQKCDLQKFEDFVSNELSSMVVQCAGDVCSDPSSKLYETQKFTSNNSSAKRNSAVELKETNQSQDEEQAAIAVTRDKQQNISPGKLTNIKGVTHVLQNGQKEKLKRNGMCPANKVFPVQSMSLRSRTKRKSMYSPTQKRKVSKVIETEISQSSSESPEEYSPKKLRSSESGKEAALSSDECSTAVLSPRTLSSKRKADSPRKYSPLKQGNLTETIVTKQLRSRILISEELSEANDEQDDSDYVTEELFDALRKCHLSESPQRMNGSAEISKNNRNVFAEERQWRLLPKHLVDKQRVLATEDGLFYAGHIKLIEPPDVYGIVLDGERGTKPHVFSREEILSDTMLEVKPQSLLELPLGTRVCAYWSQQYRCLYPGCVAKLTSKPKPVSNELCVFVEFDDGDSGQIPIKDIRLLPPDMLKDNPEETAEDNSIRYEKVIDLKKRVHNGKIKMQKKHSRSSKKELRATMKKESVPVSDEKAIPSHCDPSNDLTTSSQITDTKLTVENLAFRLHQSGSPGKHPKRHCKNKGNSKGKLKDDSPLDEKSKKHKKYKEHHKHHRHHHRHRHHHHRHCHRHHHCKKHKHKKSITVNIVTPSQDHLNASIPSSSIPDCNSASKTLLNTKQQMEEECNECDVHSTSKELPQESRHSASLQSSGGKMASKKQVLKTRRSMHPFLTRSRKSIQRNGLPFCTR